MQNNRVVLTPAPVREIGISALQLSVGEFARIIAGSNENSIVLRVDDGLVNLTVNAFISTDAPAFCIPRVKKLNPGDVITITVGMTQAFIDEVKGVLRGGNKINAIKLVRERLGWGLRESKDFVDNLDTQPTTATTGQVVRF